jgi:hypothetical protein
VIISIEAAARTEGSPGLNFKKARAGANAAQKDLI